MSTKIYGSCLFENLSQIRFRQVLRLYSKGIPTLLIMNEILNCKIAEKCFYNINILVKDEFCMSTIDPEEYKAGQRQGWNGVANDWQKWWKTFETAGEEVSRHLTELAQIKQGSRVLDIATGIGEPAITAANQVGNSGHVLAIDISSQMLSIAKQRAISLGLQQVIEFKEGDAEIIDLSASRET